MDEVLKARYNELVSQRDKIKREESIAVDRKAYVDSQMKRSCLHCSNCEPEYDYYQNDSSIVLWCKDPLVKGFENKVFAIDCDPVTKSRFVGNAKLALRICGDEERRTFKFKEKSVLSTYRWKGLITTVASIGLFLLCCILAKNHPILSRIAFTTGVLIVGVYVYLFLYDIRFISGRIKYRRNLTKKFEKEFDNDNKI
jgi:hypothetical protein